MFGTAGTMAAKTAALAGGRRDERRLDAFRRVFRQRSAHAKRLVIRMREDCHQFERRHVWATSLIGSWELGAGSWELGARKRVQMRGEARAGLAWELLDSGRSTCAHSDRQTLARRLRRV